jgi:hypothetical protein
LCVLFLSSDSLLSLVQGLSIVCFLFFVLIVASAGAAAGRVDPDPDNEQHGGNGRRDEGAKNMCVFLQLSLIIAGGGASHVRDEPAGESAGDAAGDDAV